MYLVCNVKCMISVTLDENLKPGWRDRIHPEALTANFHDRRAIHSHQVERMIFSCAAARVRIDLVLDQFSDSRFSVPHDGYGISSAGGNKTTSDNKQTMLRTRNVAFDQHPASLRQSNLERGLNLFS